MESFKTNYFSADIREKLPPIIQNALLKVDSAFIIGGFLCSVINKSEINDIDLFCHEKDLDRLVEALALSEEDRRLLKVWQEGSLTAYPMSNCHHVYSTTIACDLGDSRDGVPIDIVTYADDFSPDKDCDFYCRTLRYDGMNVLAHHPRVLNDVLCKIVYKIPTYEGGVRPISISKYLAKDYTFNRSSFEVHPQNDKWYPTNPDFKNFL